MISFRITGLEGVEQALRELKPATGRAAVRRVLTAALQPVAEQARDLAPVDEGDLRDSIVVSTRLNSSARRRMRPNSRTGTSVYVGTASRHGVLVEFGTFKAGARPFLRPAWEATKDQVLVTIQENLMAEIERAAARAARRNGGS